MKPIWRVKYMGQNYYTCMVFATVWSCSWGVFWEQCKEYHTDSFTNLNMNRDVRDEGCSLATLGLNAFFLISPPIPPAKLSKHWGLSAIINCIYALAISHTKLPKTVFLFLIFWQMHQQKSLVWPSPLCSEAVHRVLHISIKILIIYFHISCLI